MRTELCFRGQNVYDASLEFFGLRMGRQSEQEDRRAGGLRGDAVLPVLSSSAQNELHRVLYGPLRYQD